MYQGLKCWPRKSIKILEGNIGSKISDTTYINFTLDISSQARKAKEKITTWDFKQKSFCTAKEIINKIKRQPTEWENIFANTSDKGLIAKTYEMLSKLNTKRTTQLKNGQWS